MKKFLLVIFGLVVFTFVDPSSLFAQKGGAFNYLPANVQRAMLKDIAKQANSNKLKSGAGGSTDCLVPYVCQTSGDINLTPNANGWPPFSSIAWEALKVTGVDSNNKITGIPFPVGTNVVTYDPITHWNFHPENIPISENGQFVLIRANLYNILNVNFASFSDVVMYYKTPDFFNIISSS